MIVGTSVGSFVGSLYAYGYDAFALQKIALSLERGDLAELTIPDKGFLKGERLRDFVNTKVKGTPMEKFRIPFYAVATNIKTGEEAVFASGNTGMAVQASCAIPGVFQPASFSGTSYVDGGVVNPLAVDIARRYGADMVIAVDITTGIDQTVPAGTMETIMKSIDIMYNKISQLTLGKADVVIKPNGGLCRRGGFFQTAMRRSWRGNGRRWRRCRGSTSFWDGRGRSYLKRGTGRGSPEWPHGFPECSG